MLTFNFLGNYGHIGNQMFQYASLKGIAANNNLNYAIPPKEYFGRMYNLRTNIYECFELSSLKEENIGVIDNQIRFEEKEFKFNKNLFNKCIDGIDLFGYFQSYKYFYNINDEILNDFIFKNTIKESGEKFLKENNILDFASLHIRRTDYLNISDSMYNLEKEYYIKAIEFLPENIKIVVFSDDIDWCKQQEFLNKNNVVFSNNSSYVDLYIMTKAKFNIIANSTFSWWGAWLNKNNDRIVICPKNWFGPALPNHTTDDLILKDWIKI